MNRIDDLLKADINNAAKTKQLFYEFDPLLLEAFDDVTKLFENLFQSFGSGATDDQDQAEISQIAEEVKVSENCLKEINNRSLSRRARGILLLNAYRSFMYAAVDIRRLRSISALGQLCVEIESIALISIFQTANDIAEEWFNSKSDEEGRAFFSKTKKMVIEFCKKNDLLTEWNLASNGSQRRYINNYSFSLQDVDTDHPEELIVRALYILRAQTKIFSALKLSLPEAFELFFRVTNISLYNSKIEKLFKNFEKKYPNYIQTGQ